MYNSLKHVKMLEEVGLPRNQAEAHVQMMTEIIETNLATKEDMKSLRRDFEDHRVALHQDMKDFRVEMQQDMKDFRLEMQQDMKDLKLEMQQDSKNLRTEMSQLRAELKSDMALLEKSLTIKVGAIVVATVTLAMTLSNWMTRIH